MDNKEAEARVTSMMAAIDEDYANTLEALPEGEYKTYLATHKHEWMSWHLKNLGTPIFDFFGEQGVWKKGEEIPDYLKTN